QRARRSRSRQTRRNTSVGRSNTDARSLGAIVGRGLGAVSAQGQQAPCDRPPTFAVSPKTKVAATSATCAAMPAGRASERWNLVEEWLGELAVPIAMKLMTAMTDQACSRPDFAGLDRRQS
nr:hypothetical protein [Kofleriaceae bacterium]